MQIVNSSTVKAEFDETLKRAFAEEGLDAPMVVTAERLDACMRNVGRFRVEATSIVGISDDDWASFNANVCIHEPAEWPAYTPKTRKALLILCGAVEQFFQWRNRRAELESSLKLDAKLPPVPTLADVMTKLDSLEKLIIDSLGSRHLLNVHEDGTVSAVFPNLASDALADEINHINEEIADSRCPVVGADGTMYKNTFEATRAELAKMNRRNLKLVASEGVLKPTGPAIVTGVDLGKGADKTVAVVKEGDEVHRILSLDDLNKSAKNIFDAQVPNFGDRAKPVVDAYDIAKGTEHTVAVVKDGVRADISATRTVGDADNVKVFDPVQKAQGYNSSASGVECVEITEHMGFLLGNAAKYIWRCGVKPGADPVEDLKKAIWYIKRHIALVENEVPKRTHPLCMTEFSSPYVRFIEREPSRFVRVVVCRLFDFEFTLTTDGTPKFRDIDSYLLELNYVIQEIELQINVCKVVVEAAKAKP